MTSVDVDATGFTGRGGPNSTAHLRTNFDSRLVLRLCFPRCSDAGRSCNAMLQVLETLVLSTTTFLEKSKFKSTTMWFVPLSDAALRHCWHSLVVDSEIHLLCRPWTRLNSRATPSLQNPAAQDVESTSPLAKRKFCTRLTFYYHVGYVHSTSRYGMRGTLFKHDWIVFEIGCEVPRVERSAIFGPATFGGLSEIATSSI